MFVPGTFNRLVHECAKLVSCNKPVDEGLITSPALQDILDHDCNCANGQ